EAADGHHGVAGGQLHAGGRVRPDGGRDPAVAVGVLPEERDQLGVGGAAVEQPARAPRGPPRPVPWPKPPGPKPWPGAPGAASTSPATSTSGATPGCQSGVRRSST